MTEVLPLTTTPLPLKLRVEDYLALDASGAFAAYAKTELLDGEIFFVSAQHRPHARLKGRLYRRLAEALDALGSDIEPLFEASILIPPRSTPEPDIVLTREPEGEGLVPVASVALVVEIADSTLDADLGRKVHLYASAGIPEYWVVDVEAHMIHQLWAPAGEAYGERREVAFGERIAAATITELSIETLNLAR